MLSTALFISAALLSSSRFGLNNNVLVERVGEQTRISAYGDTQIVKIMADDFEIEDCVEVLRDGLNPGRCLFAEGGLITIGRDPNGTSMTFQDAKRGNFVKFVVHPRERETAAKALLSP